jgi:M6 family metalloprotease-like protein
MPRRGFALALCLLVAYLLQGAAPAPACPVFGMEVVADQPDGTRLTVRLWGDEHYIRAEDLAGYTLVRDPETGFLCYADYLPGSEDLHSTGVAAGEPVPAGIAPGVCLPPSVLMARIAASREAAPPLYAPGIREPDQKASYPVPAVEGEVRGIALLVDFGDEPATIDPAEVEAFLNQPGYSGGGNNGSVRDYYHEISGGRLELTHEVTPYYYRAAHPKSWYEDPNYSRGWRARLLVTEALEELRRRGFDFSQYDANGDGFIDLVSCFYAGSPAWSWGLGLWPQAGEAGFQADGVTARLWQITPLNTGPNLGIACHEIGHALCQWPDLYDTDRSSRGLGIHCIMSYTVDNRNPAHPCGPLKYVSGWTETVYLDGIMFDLQAPHDANKVFVLQHPMTSTELYVIENRQRSGRNLLLPDAGLAVWHVDWRGSNNQEQQLPNAHYMVTLVQADGQWDLENNRNFGDDTDYFGAPAYTEFGPDTDPPARWWRGHPIGLYLDNISEPAPVMTFDFRDGIGRLPVQLTIGPDGLLAPWRVTGAAGFTRHGAGSHTVFVPSAGSYLITWLEVPGWQAPPPATVLVHEDGPMPELVVQYSHRPLTPVDVPALADAAPGRGGQLIDHDQDGDLDIFLVREGAPDLLLRNDGGWQFTDVTPEILREPHATIGGVWADINGNGLRECLILRRDERSLLIRQAAPGVFSGQVEQGPANLEGVVGATWLDVDVDGHLDLHLVREGFADLILRAPDRSGAALTDYQVLDILPGHSFARTVAGAWCDYDGDGRLDLYMVNLFGENVLARNRLPIRFVNATHGGLRLPWRGGTAIWGDYDNDGDFDLYVVQDGAADMLLTQYEGTFVLEADPQTRTLGRGRDAVWADFNNNGRLDLFLVRHNQPCRLLLNYGRDNWREAPLLLPELDGPAVAVLAGDLDGDGGIDLVIDRDGAPPLVLRNTMIRGNWLQVDPRGHGGHRDPFGAVLRVHAGEQLFTRQVAARSGPSREPVRVHFGLGGISAIDSLVVNWPNGYRQVLRNLEANHLVTVVQPTPGETGSGALPRVTTLLPAYPNPFNPATSLAVEIARAGPAQLTIYDVAGRRVAVVHDGELAVGRHTFRWDGRDRSGRQVAAGVYLVRLQADGQQLSQRLALVK